MVAASESEPEQWEQEIAMIITKAMQAGIATWKSDPFNALPDKAQIEVMVALTKMFARDVSKVVRPLLGPKSS